MAGLAMGLFIPSALAQLKVTSTHGGNFVQGQPTALYTLSVQNTGAAATNAVSVTDSLPLGLTATAISGPGWQCSLANLNCFRSDALAAGGIYPPITVTVSVASGVTSPLTNQVSAATSGGTVTASDSTTIIPAFTDVFASSPGGFLPFIDLLQQSGITKGCQSSPPMYCPNDNIPESQMAVFVIRSVNGDDNFAYTPTPYFTDVAATNLYFPWIQKMQDLGIGLPCSTTQYCPDSAVTRGIMAVLIIRSRFGVATPTNYPATPFFTDVPASHPYFPWIQKMKQLGITSGCTPTTYCPDDPVTRGQMAVFIMRGEFNQGLQDPTTPVLVWANPAGAFPGKSATATIVGQNTNFSSVTQVNAGPGITVSNVNVTNGTTLTVQLTVASNAALGSRSITATTGTEEATLPNGFRVTGPTAPGNLTAIVASASQINLSWTASNSGGLANYLIERCQGPACSNFTQVASVAGTATTYNDTGLTVSTTYNYRVRAIDTASNMSGYSNVASATTGTTGFDGSWSGTTNQGLNVSFTVANSAVTLFDISEFCGPVDREIFYGPVFPNPISNGRFSSGSIVTSVISGTFDSTTTAHGSYTRPASTKPFAPPDPGCTLTWTASRQ